MGRLVPVNSNYYYMSASEGFREVLVPVNSNYYNMSASEGFREVLVPVVQQRCGIIRKLIKY